MPKDAISRMNTEVVHVMGLAEIRNRLPPLGIEPTTNTPEEFAAYLRADVAKWAKVVRESGAQVQ
jgi:tripartite-type tricarboxylate transporter receptor subunit TctC